MLFKVTVLGAVGYINCDAAAEIKSQKKVCASLWYPLTLITVGLMSEWDI